MKKWLLLALLLAPLAAAAQFVPHAPAKAAFCLNPSGIWIPIATTPTASTLPSGPPAADLYAINGTNWFGLACDANGNLSAGSILGYTIPTLATGCLQSAGTTGPLSWATCGGGGSTVGCPNTSSANAQCYLLPNGGSGTSLNLAACWTTANHPQTLIQTCPVQSYGTDNPLNYVGVVVAGAGTTGQATVQTEGAVDWICDGTVSITGYWVAFSQSVAGECTQPSSFFPPAPNENPEGNTVAGNPLIANTGAGTAATIYLRQYPGYANGSGTGFILDVGAGSQLLTRSHWFQNPSTDHIPYAFSGPGLALNERAGFSGNAYFGQSTLGASGFDIMLDTITWGSGGAMTRVQGSQYQVPFAPTISGSSYYFQNFGHALDVGGTSGMYILQLTGSITPANPLTDDNAGHVLYWEIEPPASGGPYTFTWPSNFVNAPTVVLSSGGTAVTASFLFDGTNYNHVQ